MSPSEGLLTFDEAVERILAGATPVDGSESVRARAANCADAHSQCVIPARAPQPQAWSRTPTAVTSCVAPPTLAVPVYLPCCS